MFLEQTFTIYHDNGNVDIVEDMWEYVWAFGGINRFYGSMKFNLGVYKEKKQVRYGSWFEPRAFEHDTGFFMYTSTGKMVSPDLFLGEWKKYESYQYRTRYPKGRRVYSWGKSHTTRNLKGVHTTPARRAACAVLKEEGEPEFRGTRRSLPNSWDDMFSRASCSWKDCTKRKRQHKGS